jgi:hypothetical protein
MKMKALFQGRRTDRLRSACLRLGILSAILAPVSAFADERSQHLANMKAIASSIRVFSSKERIKEAVIVPVPVLRYSDSTRELQESSLWIWESTGRPSAIVAIEFYTTGKLGPRWLYEVASLSTERIAVDRPPELRWEASQPGLAPQVMPDSEPAATTTARRMVQMKSIHRRFTAYEKAPVGGRIELRPLSSPLYRYSDSTVGVTDGAIFAFANGTNPEVLLILEARSAKDGTSMWHYSLAQMTGAEVAVELDGQEIWRRGEADPPTTKPSYVNGWIPK